MSSRGGEIDLEVAGVDDDADGGFDGEGDAIDQRVGDADGLDGEGAEGELFLGRDLDELVSSSSWCSSSLPST